MRYQDVSHLRAPYKDSYLSGFGADAVAAPQGLVMYIPETVSIGGASVQRIARPAGWKAEGDRSSQLFQYINAISPMTVDADMNRRPQPDKLSADGKSVISTGGNLVSPPDAVKFNTTGLKASEYIGWALRSGLYIVGPLSLNPLLTGGVLYAVAKSELAAAAAPGSQGALVLGPEDVAKGGMNLAKLAGYGAVGLLVIAAISMMAGKSKRRV